MRRLAVLATLVAGTVALVPTSGCTDDGDVTIPVKRAPAPATPDAVEDEARADTASFVVVNGDWLDDEEDAPHYALAWLAHQGASPQLAAAKARALTLLDGDPIALEKIENAQGLAEYLVATGDASVRAPLDGYVDRLDAAIHATGDFVSTDFEPPTDGGVPAGSVVDAEAARLGPTALTAMIATLEADLTLFAGEDRKGRVLAIDAAIRTNALTDLTSGATGQQARAYAFAPDLAGIFETPNIAMLIEKARVYRLTKDLSFQLEARAIYAALQALKLSSSPATYASPSGKDDLDTDSDNLTLLSSQADMAFALMLMFEITGEDRFIDEADSALDEIAALRGPWCSPATLECGTGFVHHVLDGALAKTLCAGCTYRILCAIGYRHTLAGQAF